MENKNLTKAYSISMPYGNEQKFCLYCVCRAVVINKAQPLFMVVIYQSDTIRRLFEWTSLKDVLENMSSTLARQNYISLAEKFAQRLETDIISKGYKMLTPASAQEIALDKDYYLAQ